MRILRKSMSILEVARRARVSTATVSRVLNGSELVRPVTTERVKRAIAELNYVRNSSARGLRMGRTHLFGLIVSDINNPFFPELIDAFEGLATRQGIDVIFTHTNYDTKRLEQCIRRMVERNVDAIAVMTSEMDPEALRQAPANGIGLVLLNQPELQKTYLSVAVEYSRGFEEALEHLSALGHRDIGFIAGPSALSSSRRRRENWEAAMKRAKLRVRPEWVVVGDMRVEGGVEAMRKLLGHKRRPSAVLTTNDLMAVGALEALSNAGVRVPEDMSLIGFDDLPIAGMVFPRLTTIRLPRNEIAARAFDLLLQSVNGHQKASSAVIQPSLFLRKSTGPAPSR